MHINTAQEVISCLPQGKTPFVYFKDRYAAFILAQVIDKQCPVSWIKQSKFSGLIDKPMIKKVIAQSGNGMLLAEQLEMLWSDNAETFLLSLDIWGHGDRHWDQVSRPGHNIVLQLNFYNKHDRIFRRLLKPDIHHGFAYCDHPVMQKGNRNYFRETLAWARIDFDFDSNEALIEELQTDWLRIAKRTLKQIASGRQQCSVYGTHTSKENMQEYLLDVLSVYGKIWDEAMLTAAIQFIHKELGLHRIYLHTADSGAAIKKIQYRQPPKSLYSSLPKKFCFSQTDKAPEFLCRSRAFRSLEKKLGGTRWNVINFGGQHAYTH